MRSSSRVNIAASAQRVNVDNRISLRFYYRIADNILKQADIFREENNIIDLYIMLLRFSSLISETIPCHRDYRLSSQSKKVTLKKKLLNAMRELEELKPAVQLKVDELNRKHIYQVNEQDHLNHNGFYDSSLEWPPVKKQTFANYNIAKAAQSTARELVFQGSRQVANTQPIEEQFHRVSLNIISPKEETLSRHSILGPNGLRGQWQPPHSDKGVQYPSNIDLTPVEIPSLLNPLEGGHVIKEDSSKSKLEKLNFESNLPPNEDSQTCHGEELCSLISFETMEPPPNNIIRQPSPPPVLADVKDLIPATSPSVSEAVCGLERPSQESFLSSESPLQLHISTAIMENFMRVAKSNTDKNLETCGVLAGSLKNRKFYVTALIIPKQESTSDSCQTTNEEEIFEVQDKQSLFPLGWIHTHPTQSCFMSSIDVHTHYSYQIMLPESIAIVMAPKDTSRKHGIFRLTTPGGMSAIRHCDKRGFHPHEPLPNGEPLYKQCTDVYINPNLKLDVIDLR